MTSPPLDQPPPLQHNTPDGAPPPEELIDGGHIGQLEEVPFQPEKHRAETTKRLAFLLVGAFVGSWALHYLALALFLWCGHREMAQVLSEDFKTWLPVISASAGGAIAYYFAKEKR